MTVRSKFMCNEVAKVYNGYGDPAERVKFHPVYGSPEKPANAEWSKATPSGSLELYITNPGAHGAFVPGKEYFLDITEASE